MNPFERLVSEQDIADATPESKLIDIDEEDEIDIFLVTLSFLSLCKLFILYGFRTDSIFLVFPISSYVAFMCLPTTIWKDCVCMSMKSNELPPQMSAPLE